MPKIDVFHFPLTTAIPIGERSVSPHNWLLGAGVDPNDCFVFRQAATQTVGVRDPAASMALSLASGSPPSHQSGFVEIDGLVEEVEGDLEEESVLVFTNERNLHEAHDLLKELARKVSRRFIYIDGSDRSFSILRDERWHGLGRPPSVFLSTHARAQRGPNILPSVAHVLCF